MKDLDPLTTLAHTITQTLEQGAQALIEQRSGYPAGGTGGSPSSTSDRTGMLATIRADKGPERSDQDYDRAMYLLPGFLNHLVEQGLDELDQVINLLQLATTVLIELAVAGQDMQFLQQRSGLFGANFNRAGHGDQGNISNKS